MQPRPRMPMNGGMGPGMFGGRNPFMAPGPYQSMMRPQVGPFSGRNPMLGSNVGPSGMNRGGGGLLSRILGRGAQARNAGGLLGMQGAGRAAGGGGLLQSLSNPQGLSSILNNTQQVLQTAQSIGPMIQQYGPMVRNLPALWKLYRGFKNASSDSDSSSQTETKNTQTESPNNKATERTTSKNTANRKQKSTSHTTKSAKNRTQNRSQQKGSSIPKMYI